MNDEIKPFNDAIDHLSKIEGYPAGNIKTDIKTLPKPIRYIGYFFITFLSIGILLILILNILY